jgi:microcystin degradation protein MlrC
MRIFIAALGTETNTFSPLPTGRKTFEETLWVRRDASLSSDNYFVLPLKEWRRLAEAAGDEVIESLSAFAQPAGRTVQAVWEELRDTLLGDLRAAGPVHLVLLNLHGAMASEQCDDCEGELVELVRQVVGPDVTIGVEFDLHCHISERLMRNADLLVLYKEYPHTDVAERGAELFELARRTVLGEIKPVMALRDLRMLDVWRTSDAPVRELVNWMQAAEQRDGVLSVSFGHGFPWADVPDVGAKTVVVTDGDRPLAEAVAKALGDRIWALRETYKANLLDVSETMAAIAAGNGCTVVADISDNAGCGAASDSTFLLEPLLAAKAERALFGLVWDPSAVRIAEEAGEGATLRLRIGGKVSAMSGRPVDVEARVLKIIHDAKVTYGDGKMPMGDAVLLDAGGVHIVINTIRTQTFNPDAFTQFGIELRDYRTVVLKSAQHFHAGFAPVADRIIYAVAEGTSSPDFRALPLPRAGRPLWPQVEDPWG